MEQEVTKYVGGGVGIFEKNGVKYTSKGNGLNCFKVQEFKGSYNTSLV